MFVLLFFAPHCQNVPILSLLYNCVCGHALDSHHSRMRWFGKEKLAESIQTMHIMVFVREAVIYINISILWYEYPRLSSANMPSNFSSCFSSLCYLDCYFSFYALIWSFVLSILFISDFYIIIANIQSIHFNINYKCSISHLLESDGKPSPPFLSTKTLCYSLWKIYPFMYPSYIKLLIMHTHSYNFSSPPLSVTALWIVDI